MVDNAAMAAVDEVRAFNRFYTRQIGVLEEKLLSSEFSLTEVRVLYELANRNEVTAGILGRDLNLDAGYLSRILRKFEDLGFLKRSTSASDGRQSMLRLTTKGRRAFEPLNRRSCEQVEAMLAKLSPSAQQELLRAMADIRRHLGDAPRTSPFLLREHRPGDLGWIIQRNAELYAREYSWNHEYETLVVEIVTRFARNFDPKRERCWIAEREGDRLGSVMLVRESESVGRLRLLLVEPHARGLGLGRALVNECIRFATEVGYETLTLWTNDILVSARKIYQAAGFQLVEEKPHHAFGHDLVSQEWQLKLPAVRQIPQPLQGS